MACIKLCLALHLLSLVCAFRVGWQKNVAAAAAGNNVDPDLAVWFGDPSSPQQQEEEEEVVNLSPQQYQLLMDLMDVMEDSGLVGESGDRDNAASDGHQVDNHLAGYDDAVLGLKDEGAQDEKLGSERGVGSPGKRSGSNLSMQLSMSVLRDMLRTNTRHRLSKLNAIG